MFRRKFLTGLKAYLLLIISCNYNLDGRIPACLISINCIEKYCRIWKQSYCLHINDKVISIYGFKKVTFVAEGHQFFANFKYMIYFHCNLNECRNSHVALLLFTSCEVTSPRNMLAERQ